MAQNSQFTLFLIGPVGHGKSTFCNFLFRQQRFHEKESAATLTNSKSKLFDTNISTVEYNGTQITLFDFPGFLDYRFPSEKIYNEIRRAGLKVNPDCFVYVINFSERMSAAEFKDMQIMIESFGTGVWEHLFVIFTFEDKCTKYFPGQTGREFVEFILKLEEAPDALVNLMPKINKRYMILDNKTHGDDNAYWNSMFTELIGLMNEVRELNQGVPFDGKKFGPGMEMHRQQEIQEMEEEQRNREAFKWNIAKFYHPTQKLSIFSWVKFGLKNFYKTYPNYVIFFILMTPLGLLLCNFVSHKLN